MDNASVMFKLGHWWRSFQNRPDAHTVPISVYWNKRLPIGALSTKELNAIFQGKETNPHGSVI